MGPYLVPTLQVKNMMRDLVKAGAVVGDKAEPWQRVLNDEAKVASTRAKADAGDTKAMNTLGQWHLCGLLGLKKDRAEAVRWFKKSAAAHDAEGRAALRQCTQEPAPGPRQQLVFGWMSKSLASSGWDGFSGRASRRAVPRPREQPTLPHFDRRDNSLA